MSRICVFAFFARYYNCESADLSSLTIYMQNLALTIITLDLDVNFETKNFAFVRVCYIE